MKALVYHGPGARSWETVPDAGITDLRHIALDDVEVGSTDRDRVDAHHDCRSEPGGASATTPTGVAGCPTTTEK